MSWFDDLRPASFRGVAFFVDTGEKQFGPRVITHEFPRRAEPSHEFNGRVPQEFALEAILLGDDSVAQTVAFEAALSEESPGRLVHPIYGEIDVVVIPPVRSRFSTSEGRVQRFSLTFQRAGAEPSPVASIDTAAAVDRAGTDALSAALDDFASSYSTAKGASFVSDDAASFVRLMSSGVERQFRVAGLSEMVSDGTLASNLTSLLGLSSSAMPQARALGTMLLSLFTLPPKSTPLPTSLPPALIGLGGTEGLGSQVTPAPITTPSRVIAADNQASIVTLMRTGATVAAVRSAALIGWVSRDQALEWREAAAAALADIADRMSDSETAGWQKIVDLRAAMVKDVTTRAAPLPRLYTVQPVQTTSATLLAFQIDGDALSDVFARADEIASRNAVKHPGFITGGTNIEVLK